MRWQRLRRSNYSRASALNRRNWVLLGHMTVHAIDVAVKAVPAPQDAGGQKQKGGRTLRPAPPKPPKGGPWGARNYAQIMFDVPATGLLLQVHV